MANIKVGDHVVWNSGTRQCMTGTVVEVGENVSTVAVDGMDKELANNRNERWVANASLMLYDRRKPN